MMNLMLSLLFFLFTAPTTFAQIPPPNVVKSQAGQKQTYKYNLNVPNNGVTPLGGLDVLLEAANGNVLANPGFEGSPFNVGWSCPNFSCISQTTYFTDGKQGGTVSNANSVNTVVEQSVTPTFPITGRQWQVGMWVNTNVTGFQVCSLLGGVEQSCVDVQGTSVTSFVQTPILTPTTATTIGVRLKSINANAKQVFWDQAFITPISLSTFMDQGGLVAAGYQTGASGCTFSFPASAGSPSTPGSNASCPANNIITANPGPGTVIAATNNVIGQVTVNNLPPGTYIFEEDIYVVNTSAAGNSIYVGTIDGTTAYPPRAYFNQPSTGSNLTTFRGVFNYSNTQASRTFNFQSGSGAGTVVAYNDVDRSVTWRIYRAPQSSPFSAYAIQNSNYDWRPFTTVATNATISSQSCLEKREGPNNRIKCNIQFSGGSASPIQLTMPNGNIIESTKFTTAVRRWGSGDYAGTGGNTHAVIAAGGNNYFGIAPENNASYTPSVSMNGSALGTASNYSFDAEFPIAGWSENQNAPQLIGSVVNSTTNVSSHMFSWLGGASVSTVCNSSPCTMYGGSSALTVTRSALGMYTVSVPAGTCSQILMCGGSFFNGTAYLIPAPTAAATTTTYTFGTNSGSAQSDAYGPLTCDCTK